MRNQAFQGDGFFNFVAIVIRWRYSMTKAS
jgi:hypothetical protein